MNEQQLANLFSDQLDHLLQGQTPALPPEASELQELLDFGQQFSQISFQPSPAAQAAFQGQLASWFGPTASAVTTILGVSKPLFFTFIAAVILIGAAAGLTVFGIPSFDNSDGLSAPEVPELPIVAPEDSSQPPAVNSDSEDTPKTPQSSLEEIIPGGGTSTLGDTVPSSSPSSLGDTLSLPTPTSEDNIGTDLGTGQSITTDTNDADSDTIDEEGAQEGDHDKGHGNDADGIDEDNPGNSGDKLGNGGQGNDSQSGGLGGVGRGGNDGSGSQGGQGGNGGQGGGKGNGQGGGKGKGQSAK